MYATIPVYYPSLEEAARKDEAALWCDSYNINMSCRNFIQDKAMTAFNTRELDAFTVSLSSAQYPFQLLAVSRPVDISPLLSELSATLTSSSDVKQKELLKQEIVEMGAFALSGEVVERQFYIKIWDRVSDGVERDLLQKLKLLGGYFSDSGIQTEILEQQDIVRLCNLVNNPAYVHLEDSGINAAIPILESVGVA